MHRCGTDGFMWSARGPFPPAAAMVVMFVVGCWSLGHISTVGIEHILYIINMFFGLHILFGLKYRMHVQTCRLNFRQI